MLEIVKNVLPIMILILMIELQIIIIYSIIDIKNTEKKLDNIRKKWYL